MTSPVKQLRNWTACPARCHYHMHDISFSFAYISRAVSRERECSTWPYAIWDCK